MQYVNGPLTEEPHYRRAEPAHHVHPGLGSVVLVVVVLQAAVGIIAKRVKPPEFNYVTLQPGRHRVRLFHIGAGIIIAALLCASCLCTLPGDWARLTVLSCRLPMLYGVRLLEFERPELLYGAAQHQNGFLDCSCSRNCPVFRGLAAHGGDRTEQASSPGRQCTALWTCRAVLAGSECGGVRCRKGRPLDDTAKSLDSIP